MLASSIPTKIAVPFANSAGGSYINAIPVSSQIGIVPGAASFTDGFPPQCFLGTPNAVGPNGKDFNGILNAITQWVRWANAGGQVPYDAAFSTANSGYPINAILVSASTTGLFWISTVDGNTTNPDTGGAGWSAFYPGGTAGRIVTASGAFTTAISDNFIGLNRVSSPSVSSTTLPGGAAIGQTFTYEDLAANFNAYPLTVAAPGGMTIAGLSSFVMNVDRQSASFRFYGSNLWSVK